MCINKNKDFLLFSELQDTHETAAKLLDLLSELDDLTSANLYHVDIYHDVDKSNQVLSYVFNAFRCMCAFYLVSGRTGVCVSRFIAMSNFDPMQFQSIFEKRFRKQVIDNDDDSIYSVIF